MTDEYLSVENCAGLAVQNSFIKLAAGAMRLAMIDDRVCISVLRPVDHVESIDRTFRAFVIHLHADIVTRKGRAKVDRGRVVTRVRTELSSGRGDMKRAHTFALDLVML